MEAYSLGGFHQRGEVNAEYNLVIGDKCCTHFKISKATKRVFVITDGTIVKEYGSIPLNTWLSANGKLLSVDYVDGMPEYIHVKN